MVNECSIDVHMGVTVSQSIIKRRILVEHIRILLGKKKNYVIFLLAIPRHVQTTHDTFI